MKRASMRQFDSSVSVVAVAAVLCLAGCQGSDAGSDPAGAAGTGAGGTPSATPDVGKMLTSPVTCTEPHTICMNLQVPSTMEGRSTRLLFDIYDSPDPPSHLPNGYAGYFTAPELTPGELLHFELTDAGLQGDYWMWVIMYMEGGGYGAPVNGVDYGMESDPAALHLDGTPINIAEPVLLVR